MTYKLVVHTIQCTADADPNVNWESKYVGVVDSDTPSQKSSRIMWDAIAPSYLMMCGAINEFIDAEYGEGVLRKIEKFEKCLVDEVEAEGHAFIYWLTREASPSSSNMAKTALKKAVKSRWPSSSWPCKPTSSYCKTQSASRLRCPFLSERGDEVKCEIAGIRLVRRRVEVAVQPSPPQPRSTAG